jgi:hypothetical protein
LKFKVCLTALAACATFAIGGVGTAEARLPLKLVAKADPLVKQDRTPKVLFELQNAVRGRTYRVWATQISGQPTKAPPEVGGGTQCTGALGLLHPQKALGSRVPFDPAPFPIKDGEDGYAFRSGSPCKGIYQGKVQEKRPGYAILRLVMRFRLYVPSMAVDKLPLR